MTRATRWPDRVDERAARLVAAQVAMVGIVAMVTRWWWLLAMLALGFTLRVALGPRVSPAGAVARRMLKGRGRPRLVPAAPKRFAQSIGLVVTATGAACGAFVASDVPALALAGVIVVAASLEALFGLCIGCRVHAVLASMGVVSVDACETCVVEPASASLSLHDG